MGEYLGRVGGHFRTIRDDIKLVRVGEENAENRGRHRRMILFCDSWRKSAKVEGSGV